MTPFFVPEMSEKGFILSIETSKWKHYLCFIVVGYWLTSLSSWGAGSCAVSQNVNQMSKVDQATQCVQYWQVTKVCYFVVDQSTQCVILTSINIMLLLVDQFIQCVVFTSNNIMLFLVPVYHLQTWHHFISSSSFGHSSDSLYFESFHVVTSTSYFVCVSPLL